MVCFINNSQIVVFWTDNREFADNESAAFDDIMNMLKKYPDFRKYALKDEAILSLPGLEIRPERRKIYSNSQEISTSIFWRLIKGVYWPMDRFTETSGMRIQSVERELLLCITYEI